MGIGGSYLNSKVDIGDIVFADWGRDGRFDHAMSVVSKSSTDTNVAYHSNNVASRSMLSISAQYPSATFETYHIQ